MAQKVDQSQTCLQLFHPSQSKMALIINTTAVECGSKGKISKSPPKSVVISCCYQGSHVQDHLRTGYTRFGGHSLAQLGIIFGSVPRELQLLRLRTAIS